MITRQAIINYAKMNWLPQIDANLIDTEIEKYNTEEIKASIPSKVYLWDKVSPINGTEAELFMHDEIVKNADSIYVVEVADRVYFQPHVPGVPGILYMDEATALELAQNDLEEKLTQIADNVVLHNVIAALWPESSQ